MSDAEKKKKEMIEILERIPQSGSFQRAELTKQVSELMEQYNALTVTQSERLVAVPASQETSEKDS